jgi:hypothetical protein
MPSPCSPASIISSSMSTPAQPAPPTSEHQHPGAGRGRSAPGRHRCCCPDCGPSTSAKPPHHSWQCVIMAPGVVRVPPSGRLMARSSLAHMGPSSCSSGSCSLSAAASGAWKPACPEQRRTAAAAAADDWACWWWACMMQPCDRCSNPAGWRWHCNTQTDAAAVPGGVLGPLTRRTGCGRPRGQT